MYVEFILARGASLSEGDEAKRLMFGDMENNIFLYFSESVNPLLPVKALNVLCDLLISLWDTFMLHKN